MTKGAPDSGAPLAFQPVELVPLTSYLSRSCGSAVQSVTTSGST